ncbi:BatD family protein [Fusobacterium sp.]|uniref:BatD family protein n=1 Tax=Fusobacterium sp. TaxID=68766 RepID=UPI001E09D028|nr:BatD family protein [Fusobacterium sp.]MBS5790718.1 BatD family protein [Fusobacterium sp.]
MKKIVSLLLFLLISVLTFTEATLDVNNTNPRVNEPIALNVEFTNSDREDYTIEGLDNFKVLSKGVQRSYTVVNGKKSSTILDKYTLLPIKEGTFTLQLKGGKETSNPLEIIVSKEAKVSNVNISDKISLKTEPKNNQEYYFGEKIPFEEKLLTTVPISDMKYVDPPVFNNFSVKDIFPTEQNRRYPEKTFTTPQGKQGLELTLQQSILQPNSSGEKTIKSAHIAVVENNNNDMWYYGRQPVVYLGGEEIKLNILPLPTNQPTGFQNVVGKLKGEFSWNRDEVNIGESILLTLKLYGDVNLDTLEKIIPYDIAGFNIFESVKSSSEKIINGKYYSEKTFEIAFIPRTTNEKAIPEIKIPYFDTESKSYKYFTIPSKSLKVLGAGTTNSNLNNAKPTQQQSLPATSNVSKEEPKQQKLDKVEISNIPAISEEVLDSTDHKHLIKIYGIMIGEGLIILILLFLLLRRKKENKGIKYDFRSMKRAKDDLEFYELYCNLMKQQFNFSPKVHLEDRLVKSGASNVIVQLNRDIEEKMYNLEPLNKNEIIKILKKEIK